VGELWEIEWVTVTDCNHEESSCFTARVFLFCLLHLLEIGRSLVCCDNVA
jgi:hypothetical protein